jgi:hypothetical protein
MPKFSGIEQAELEQQASADIERMNCTLLKYRRRIKGTQQKIWSA